MRSLVIAIAVVLGLGIAAPASAEPPTTHEVIYTKPSGFWTSNRPATGGSYRWRLLGIGVVLLGITGFGMMRLVRKAAAEREARSR
jgi:hypothetical protein